VPRASSPAHSVVAGGAACGLFLLAWAAGPTAADRDARVITPSGSPVLLDPLRALLFDSPGVAVMLENRHSAPTASALRIWIFDADLRLRGSADYCTVEAMDRNTRGQVFVPLEFAGITLRDHAVVTVSAAGSDQSVWRMREVEAAQLSAARSAARGGPAHLGLVRDDDTSGRWACACDARAIEASCLDRCADRGLAAHTVTPFQANCTSSCTCR
jgi:hypothetical protein